MRRLALEAVLSLAVLAAAPWLGSGSQVQASWVGFGVLDSTEAHLIAQPAETPTSAWVVEESCPALAFETILLEAAPGPVGVAHQGSLGFLDSVFVSFLRLRVARGSGETTASTATGYNSHSVCTFEVPQIPPPDLATLLFFRAQTNLPAPPILDLLDPPRGC